jgi:hypothetical protein
MGQPVSVTRKTTNQRGVVRFELNRSVTGMGHERYTAPPDPGHTRPTDELARRLFAHGDVAAVALYSNQVTVELVPFGSDEGLQEVIEGLYTHYTPGVTPSIP